MFSKFGSHHLTRKLGEMPREYSTFVGVGGPETHMGSGKLPQSQVCPGFLFVEQVCSFTRQDLGLDHPSELQFSPLLSAPPPGVGMLDHSGSDTTHQFTDNRQDVIHQPPPESTFNIIILVVADHRPGFLSAGFECAPCFRGLRKLSERAKHHKKLSNMYMYMS